MSVEIRPRSPIIKTVNNMCTITKECPVLQTAEQDIIVYKNVVPFINIETEIISIRSFCRNFIYYPNKVMHTRLDKFVRANIFENYVSERGFYSYRDKLPYVNAVFIIPKGAEYYLCQDLETKKYIYHSNQIMFIKLI